MQQVITGMWIHGDRDRVAVQFDEDEIIVIDTRVTHPDGITPECMTLDDSCLVISEAQGWSELYPESDFS